MAQYIFNHFREVTTYFGLPAQINNRAGSISYDTDTIRKLNELELRRNRKIVSITTECPRLNNRTNYSSPHDNTHWAWETRNYTGIDDQWNVGDPVKKVSSNGFWKEVAASSSLWVGSIISEDLEPDDIISIPNPPTSTPTPSVSDSPTPTPTPTITTSISPTVTPSITQSITPTETSCPLATPTPTITPNLNAIDCLLHIELNNLKPDSLYRSNIQTENSNIIPKPSEFVFRSMNNGTQNLWILLNRVEINQQVPINIVTQIISTSQINSEEYKADHVVSILFSRNCGCELSTECPAKIIDISTDINTTVNYDGCVICSNNPTADTIGIDDGIKTVGAVGTLGQNSYYGTYDQNGNVWEWTESGPFYRTRKYLKGGSYLSGLSEIDSQSLLSTKTANITEYSAEFGFRIASYTNPDEFPCFVDVPDTCNIADDKGLGKVKYNYKIHKYAVTNYDYMVFLNAVAFDKSTDILNLYKPEMEQSIHGGIIRIFNTDKQRYEYATKPNMEYKPVNFVSWIDSARYCNWLNNLQTTSDTESGAYDLSDISLLPSNLVITNSTNEIINKAFINNSLISTNRIWKESAFLTSNLSKKSDRLPSTADIVVDNLFLKNLKGLSFDIYFKEDIEQLDITMLKLKWCGSNITPSVLRTKKINNKGWNIFIPKYLLDKDGGYSLTIGGVQTEDYPNAKKLLLDPIIIFFIVDQDNNLSNLNALSFEGSNCYRDFGIVSKINPNITRNYDAKYFLPNEHEWHKSAYYDHSSQKYYKHATQSNKQPFCPEIDEDGFGPYPRDFLCDCDETKICGIELIDITDNYYSFSINLTKNTDCCNVEYKFSSPVNNNNEWIKVDDSLIDCNPYYYPPIVCRDIIP